MISLLWTGTWVRGICGLVLAITYSLLIRHALKGNRSKWVIGNALLILFSGLFIECVVVGYVMEYKLGRDGLFSIWIISIGSGGYDGL